MILLPRLFLFFFLSFCLNSLINAQESEHDKAIRAVNEGEILPLDLIIANVNKKYNGRVLSVNLQDSEKGLFGWVYDIMIIENNEVVQLRVDAGTSTILSVQSGREN